MQVSGNPTFLIFPDYLLNSSLSCLNQHTVTSLQQSTISKDIAKEAVMTEFSQILNNTGFHDKQPGGRNMD